MNSLCFVACLIAIVVATGSCKRREEANLSTDAKLAQTAPNIFVIVIDAASAGYFGCYGDKSGTSPNIDEFARENILFECAYSQTASTVTSTASLLTSTRATTHLMTAKTMLPSEFKTAPELLSSMGFACHGVIGNPWAGAPPTGLNRGYTNLIEVYKRPELEGDRRLEESSEFVVTLPADINEDAFGSIESLERNGSFVYIHYLQPHKPYDPPQKYLEEFECLEPAWDELHERWDESNESGTASDETIKQLENRYRANIKYVDNAVGELLAKLRGAGLYDDALIVITSDHGDAFFKHRQFGHNVHLYDDMLRVPLLVKLPLNDRIAPRRISVLVESIDVIPTIFDYIGAKVPAQFEGDSLLPLMTGETSRIKREEVIVCTIQRSRHAIRVRDYKYIIASTSYKEELYHLGDDPDEQRNLIGTADGQRRADALRQLLESVVDLKSGKALQSDHSLLTDESSRKLMKTLGYVEDEGGDISDEAPIDTGSRTRPPASSASQPSDR